ncbi:Hypothetical protein FKW44_001813 [Caligus rogercresseyi]|uniref:Uncharacterized protein n=1 Tax=Caligus rogercresseyi TaxID=217165 RepID=A0A7T8KJ91_CALRO|nr:Hypothetical protein FKW44_001813 [Caligus rogercresseyi]
MDMRDHIPDGSDKTPPSSPTSSQNEPSQGKRPDSLKSLCVKNIISHGIPYFQGSLPESLEDLLSESYRTLNICDNCGSPLPKPLRAIRSSPSRTPT